ncbi:Pimeloyl-ACP methyl ester carboxylesterase [Ekhidna lutea]|uniref:Pimeloyl-ACP methyl ester carboxylesterase n=1 Tax=Ekhidna lutea TaxID=447679 RepID=A0A239EJZ9_EKHLU|nr:alpha/beta fold hydrolase [Ekhidna lutea]SNS44947.1 Pimeloyl-ACP methyl ester carboxylesterase [Ekhidna lutea]
MKLNFRTLGEGEPLIIMHGVFGSSDNWQTLGKVFAENFKVYLVDLRNHGNSPHSDEFDYDVMVKDVVELMDDEGLPKALILGHSMGGKVAMHLATEHSEKVDKLIVVDIAPKYYPPHHQQIFDGFHSVDLDNLENRKDADEQMSKVIANMGVRQFILKNLDRKKDGSFAWKLNVDAIQKAIEKVGEGIEGSVSFEGVTLFIAGGKSDYITESDHDLIREHFPKAVIATVKDAGHWVHAEKPKELGEMVMEFLT